MKQNYFVILTTLVNALIINIIYLYCDHIDPRIILLPSLLLLLLLFALNKYILFEIILSKYYAFLAATIVAYIKTVIFPTGSNAAFICVH